MSASAIETRSRTGATVANQPVALIDILDRLLEGGVVLHGDIILSVAEIDLVRLDLRLLISSIDKAMSE